MNNETKILFPVEVLTLNGEAVEVSELKWPDAVAWLGQLGQGLAKYVGSTGRLGIDLGELTALVMDSAELSESLVLKSTGKPKEWLASISCGQFLAVLDTALKLNLSDDLLDRAKKIGARLAKLAPQARLTVAPISPDSTTSSSGKAGAVGISTDAPSDSSTCSPGEPTSGCEKSTA